MHISSGLAAGKDKMSNSAYSQTHIYIFIVAYAMVIGKRRDYHENVNTPHNVSFVFLGLALMWFGKNFFS